ncbi:hypothetical protein MFIFM68171_08102 [Madurella fahalii]|uniref:Uncharacterized protein n=1 Tax=Madurella fahalii TaxID=1157608 RepID=A0ABQ0GJI1_9PEZI
MYSHNERGVRNQAAYGQAHNRPETYGESPASGPAPTTAGHHKHDILNKLDPRVDSTHDRQPMPTHQNNNNNIPEGTYGPHSSRLANALDPRVDSDLDGSSRMAGAGVGGVGGAGGPAPPPPGMMGAAASGAPAVGGGGAFGPHSSRTANALDPRVDADTGRSHHHHQQPGMGMSMGTGTGTGTGGRMDATHMPAGTGGAPAAAAVPAAAGAGGVSTRQTAGPHRSDLMNKLDPRVDSKTGAMKGGLGETRRGV